MHGNLTRIDTRKPPFVEVVIVKTPLVNREPVAAELGIGPWQRVLCGIAL